MSIEKDHIVKLTLENGTVHVEFECHAGPKGQCLGTCACSEHDRAPLYGDNPDVCDHCEGPITYAPDSSSCGLLPFFDDCPLDTYGGDPGWVLYEGPFYVTWPEPECPEWQLDDPDASEDRCAICGATADLIRVEGVKVGGNYVWRCRAGHAATNGAAET